MKWLQGLRNVYGLEFDALGCRNEKGVSYDFVKKLRATLNSSGFQNVKVHAFDNWPDNKLDFVKDMLADEKLRDAIDIISAHTFTRVPASAEVQAMAAQMNKPIWNTEEHVYLKGFDCAITIVRAFNENFLRSGATKVVNWYDIAGVYPVEPYSEDPAMLLARSPWSGHYEVREALWGYAHYGQFTEAGWEYLNGGCGDLTGGGTYVTLKSPDNDYSVIIETKGATTSQKIRFQTSGGLSAKELCVWRSNAKEQFIQQAGIKLANGAFTLTLEPDSIYSLSTTTGQQKGSFANVPADKPFPFPYYETFDEYSNPNEFGCLPRYTADIADVFEIADRPDKKGKCLRQVCPVRPIPWAPEYMPYTVLGDDQWQDYEVSVDVYLYPGDSAGVMGRVNHVGPGYRSVPKGYFLTLDDTGECRLVVIRGLKQDKKKLEGDAEQQARIKAGRDDSEGGEKMLGTNQLAHIRPNEWHNLKLRFEGSIITALVDDQPVLTATNNLYTRGMAGLRAGSGKVKLSTPYFDNLLIKAINTPVPPPAVASPRKTPIYSSSTNYSIRDFGAVGDGKSVETAAIQKALDAVATNGGGEVRVPAGRYVTGSLVMQSHTTLHLEAGATLLGSSNRNDYPIVRARWEGIETNCHRALIVANHANNVAITGAGSIAGNPVVGRLRNPRGPAVIELTECSNIRVEGVTLKSTRMWTLHPTYCQDVHISGVTFDTEGANSDGIDVDSCRRVFIEGCTFTTGDDNIAIKSGKGQEGVRVGRPSEDITITNCTFIKGYVSIALGSELSGGIRRVHISHCTFKQGLAALQLKSREGRAGYLEDITAEHLMVGPEPLLELTTNYRYNPDPQGVLGAEGLTQFRNIRISDVKVDSQNLLSIEGTEEKLVDGIKISRVTGTVKEGSVIQNATNVVFHDIHLEGFSGPQYFTNNVAGTGLEGSAPLSKRPAEAR